MPNKQYEFKVVVLGDKSVGKTCLVLRFIEGYFAPKQQSTIGAFFLAKTFTLPNGAQCKMQLWDTAGQERFRAMAPVSELLLLLLLLLCVLMMGGYVCDEKGWPCFYYVVVCVLIDVLQRSCVCYSVL
jgi:hypothetical protein